LPALRRGPSPGTAEAGTEAGTGSAARREGRGWRDALARLQRLIGDNPLFSAALALSVVPRVIATLGFRPAVLFRLDTFDYLWDAVHLTPNPVNPSGYALFLALLRPFHSLTLVTVLQHVMGLAIAVMIYALLRSRNVTRWLATLAAVPVLFDPGQILLEHLIMADILGLFLMVAAFTVVLIRRTPSVWRSASAGLLMGASALVRPTTLPLIVALAVYLLATHAGWRKAGTALLAGALPVLGYMSWFAAANGSFNLTNSNGLFLWSRTMSFADCATIKPPPDLRALCPTAQPGVLSQPVAAKRPRPSTYLWDHDAWQWQPPSNALVPDVAAFNQANNSRALRFAIRAIVAQPLTYATIVLKGTVGPLVHTNAFRFPVPPETGGMGAVNARYAQAAVRAYTGSSATPFLAWHLSTGERHPYAGIMNSYQRVIFLPGPLFGLIAAIGLAGIIIPRRRSGAAALLWISAVIILALPTAEHEYTYRYVIPAVPLVCMAAALAFRRRGEDDQPATVAIQQRDPAREPARPDPGPGHPDPRSGHPDPGSGHPDPRSGHPDPRSGQPDPEPGRPGAEPEPA
jgi:hypothetical protein